uniref:Uncharacterized protein n=1 Tax=Anguilla anguilla TaxID=7936 RepID=A0A0E9UML0_ANGAN
MGKKHHYKGSIPCLHVLITEE